jgi:hypothetical protein
MSGTGEDGMAECPFCHHLPRVIGNPPRLARHHIGNEVCQGSGSEDFGGDRK